MNNQPENQKTIGILTICYRPGADILSMWVKGEAVDNAPEENFVFHDMMEDFQIQTLNLNGTEVFAGATVIESAKVSGWQALLSAYLPDEVILMAEKVMEASAVVPRGLDGNGPIVYGGGIKVELFVNLNQLAKQFA